MPTIHDVARRAGVGAGTASRALNRSGPVSAATAERVLAAAKDLGYRPSSAARALSRREQGLIGLLTPQFHSNFFGQLLHLAEQEIRSAGKHLMVASAQGGEAAALAFLEERDCDGVILLNPGFSDTDLSALAERRPALAILNRSVKGLEEQCFATNHRSAGRSVARALLGAGHRRFAAITGPSGSADARERQAGFAEALSEAGCPLSPDLVVEGNYDFTGGLTGAEQLLASGQEFTACFCGNDEMAIAANSAFQLAGRHVTLFGYDDTAALRFSGLKISSVAIPIEAMIRSACAYVLNRCYGLEREILYDFPPKLMLRMG